MPRIQDVFTSCAVYIYKSLEDAQNGESYGGSGFLTHVTLKENPDWANVYVVTNAHVVRRAKNPVIRLNRKDGGTECIPTNSENWFQHPYGDDVSVLPFDIEFENLKFWSIDPKYFLTSETVFDEDIGIGDDTVMVGRFISHEGRQQNNPAVRFGNIAMMADEKIEVDGGLPQEAFLVEMRSLPGYSGSPVFVYSIHAENDASKRRFGRKKGEWPEGQNPNKSSDGRTTVTVLEIPNLDYRLPKGPYLLGIDFCHLHRKAYVRETGGKEMSEGWYVNENTGMAGVIPAWKIRETLDREELVAMREEGDRKITEKKRKPAGASLDAADDSAPNEVFTKQDFEDALTKVSRKK